MEELGIIDLMLPAFAECLVLVGIHSYLGLHVIKRKVIFVDLALAQVAALGTTVGFIFGMAPDSVAALLFSVLFTFLAAGVFSVVRLRNEKVPQEAIIGLVYAIAAAMIILVIDNAPHGAEHIKEVMTGALLWVKWESIIFAAIVYGLIGFFHWVFRKRFLLISNDPEKAYKAGINVRLWDFLFYMSFGIVISISVRTAGVLLVFVFLIVPAIAATLTTDKLRWQLVIGWTMGVLVTVTGLGLSYLADTPSGPSVVGLYGMTLIFVAIALYIWRTKSLEAVKRVAIGVTITAVALGIVFFGGRMLGQSSLAAGRSHSHAEGVHGPHESNVANPHKHDEHHLRDGLTCNAAAAGEGDEMARFVADLGDADGTERAKLLASCDSDGPGFHLKAFEAAKDDDIKLSIAKYVGTRFGIAHGAPLLMAIVKNAEFPFVRSEAADELDVLASQKFGYNSEADDDANKDVLQAMERWIATLAPAPE